MSELEGPRKSLVSSQSSSNSNRNSEAHFDDCHDQVEEGFVGASSVAFRNASLSGGGLLSKMVVEKRHGEVKYGHT
jgi:hypothetical protein